MEVIMSSPVQECSMMKVDKGDNGPVNLSKTEKNPNTYKLRKKKWKESKKKWKESQKEKLASDGNLSTAKEKKRKPNTKKTRRPTLGEILNPRYLELLEAGTNSKNSEKRKKQILNNKIQASDGILSTDASTQDTNKSLEALSTELKTEDHPKTANVEKGPSTDTGLTKTATLDKKMLVSSSAGTTGDERSSISLSSLQDNAYSGIGTTANLNAEVKVENKMENVVGEKGSGTNATDNSASKWGKRKRKKNPESGTTATVDQNNRVLISSATGDEKSLISKVEASSGELGSSMTTKFNAEVKIENKMETTVGETGSGTNKTDNTVSKKRKRQKKKNLESDDVLSTPDYTQDKTTTPGDENRSISGMEIDKGNGAVKLSKTEKRTSTHELRLKKWKESQKEKLASDDNLSRAKESQKEKLASDGNLSTAKEKKRKPISKKTRRPTLGEILNPQYLELLEAGTNSKNSEKRKRQKLNKKIQASVGILSTDESTQNTNESLEALSTELKTEDHPKTANVEKGPSTFVDAGGSMLKDISCTEVATISEPADLEIAEAKENTSLPIKMVKQYVTVQEKKLVIFDVNGLLADFVSPPPKDMIADFRIPRRAIFKRPFLDDFLRFCFERFHVGIWSSRTMQNLDPVVNFLLGDLKKKLLFLWDASKCTNSGMRTLEDRHKCLVLKDLRKIWEKGGPNNSWVQGRFNDTNTLLLDDSPYKALVNPKHSGIFPVSYSYKNRDDNFLGPKGELQNYLEGLAGSDNVKTYVEQHPFGKGAIDERHPQWTFYARVLKSQTR